MTGCAAPQGGSGNSGAGSTADEAGQIAAEKEEDAGGSGEKPALVVMGEEEDTRTGLLKAALIPTPI